MNQQVLVIEIRTVDANNFDSSQLHNMTIFHDRKNNSYHLGIGLNTIAGAILEIIPLLFDVQVIPGDNSDAIIASTKQSPNRTRRKRRF